jgi:hypothetical protein
MFHPCVAPVAGALPVLLKLELVSFACVGVPHVKRLPVVTVRLIAVDCGDF